LKLFDWLGKEAKSSTAATNHFGGTQEAWDIFLDALSAMGLLQKPRRGTRTLLSLWITFALAKDLFSCPTMMHGNYGEGSPIFSLRGNGRYFHSLFLPIETVPSGCFNRSIATPAGSHLI
jgi:hypothetical protein